MVVVLRTQIDATGMFKLPNWTTYRSTSSGPGQAEFMGNITHPFIHFASSDYPLPKEKYDVLKNAGKEIIHLPVLTGAIGIFHSVPLLKHEDQHVALDLNLTSCLVARIYKGEIEDWNHPDIVAINPNFDLPVQLNNYGKPKGDQSFPSR
jgi:ABC-type phosphate transport system substrate-binding protein